MKEIVTIDERQFELTVETPLTPEQRLQVITDIRKQLGCDTCKSTTSLGDGIYSLAVTCVNITVQAPPTITITGIKIGPDACTIGGACPNNIICPDVNCTSITRDVIVTFTNSGDLAGLITPILTVGGNPATPPGNITVPAKVGIVNGTADATFLGVTLARGSNDVCANYTYV